MVVRVKIQGNQINLRTLVPSDAQSVYRNAKDKDMSRYTASIPYPYTMKDARDFIKLTGQKTRNKKYCTLGIELKETGEIIGMASFMKID